MDSKLLLPNKFKIPGWYILITAIILFIISISTGWPTLVTKIFVIADTEIFGPEHYFTFVKENIIPTIIALLFILGSVLVGFSAEKKEDEFISKLRLSSLMWAVLANYILLFFAFLFIYGLDFWNVMLYNMFTVLIIFIARFHYILYRNSKPVADEK